MPNERGWTIKWSTSLTKAVGDIWSYGRGERAHTRSLLCQGLVECSDIQTAPFSNRAHSNGEFWKPRHSTADEVTVEWSVLMNKPRLRLVYCCEMVIRLNSNYSPGWSSLLLFFLFYSYPFKSFRFKVASCLDKKAAEQLADRLFPLRRNPVDATCI